MTRNIFIQEIERRIGDRKLVWWGQAGGNARPLTRLRQFARAFSIIGPADLPAGQEVCLEHLTGQRVHTLDFQFHPDQSEAARGLYRELCVALGEPSVAMTHEVSKVFASAYFSSGEHVQHLGLFHERQSVFDHKPWVESELRKAGLRVVPWRYLSTYDGPALDSVLKAELRNGPVVLRANRSGGGKGLTLVRQPEDIPSTANDAATDGFMAVAPLLEPSIPLNVNACAFPDGSVSLHSPSLQLIGIPGTALSPFNYCGNDFARVRELDTAVLQALQELVTRAGRWLSSMGYVGAFGVDAILHRGTVYLAEVNPRFQGSSLLSAHLDAALDRPDVFLAHAGAFLGLPAADPWELPRLAREQPKAAQVFIRNSHEHVARNDSSWRPPGNVDCWMLPVRGVIVHPHALLCRAIVQDSVTEDGWALRPEITTWFTELPKILFDPLVPEGKS